MSQFFSASVPKCLGSEVSVHPVCHHISYASRTLWFNGVPRGGWGFKLPIGS